MHTRTCLLAIVATVSLATGAHAQVRVAAPCKSPTRAYVLSLAGTLVPIAGGIAALAVRPQGGSTALDVAAGALIGLGAGIGPSLGHFYVGQQGRIVPRVVLGGGLALFGFTRPNMDTGGAIVLAGVAVVATLAVQDIVSAPGAARDYNTRQRASLVVVPLLADGRPRVGLGLRTTW